jgi:hypothetical protein
MLNLLLQAAPTEPIVWKNELALAIIALTPVAVRLLVTLSFFVVEKIPKWVLPITAVVLATGVDFLTGIATTDPAFAAAIALATVGLREIIDRFFTQPLGLANPLTVSDGAYLRRRS